MLRAFTRFTFNLHEKGVNFLDHSPGNTLINKTEKGYDFFLVDLNRMAFKPLNMDERILNFRRLTTHKSMVRIMSDEYANCCHGDPDLIFHKMWQATETFQRKFQGKKKIKKKLKLKS